MIVRILPALLLLTMLGALGAPAHATQTDTRGIHAVPVPGKVTVDGKLDDWDLSGQVTMSYDIENLRDTYLAKVAMMYDADHLYVGIQWKDPRPLSNHHDPRYQAEKGWAADAVQLRFKTDRIAHVTAWDFVDKNEPAIQISYGADGDPFNGPSRQLFRTTGWEMEGGAAMAFKVDADGKGYVQEMRLPWKLIVASRKVGPGDTIHCGVELLWGGSDWPDMRYADNLAPGKTSREFFWTATDSWGEVTLEPKGRLKLPPPAWEAQALRATTLKKGPIPIPYTLPKAGRVTLAVEDPNGRRVRTLVPALERPQGKNIEYWDGLDDDGKPVPPGKYTWKGIVHDPIRVNWALSFNSPGNPSWDTPDGRGAFYGDHSAPRSVAAAGDYVALACPIGEGGAPLIGCDLQGQKLWGQANRVAFQFGIQSLATDGKTLWVGSDANPPLVYRVEAATGRYAPWNRTAKDPEGRDFRVLDLPVGTADPAPATEPSNAAAPVAEPRLSALALRNGVLAVCLIRDNEVRLLDAETGDLKRTIRISHPKSVAFMPDGGLLLLSEGRILRVGEGDSTTPFTAATYPDAFGLATDATGQVCLSVRGSDQNVKVFSRDGRLLRAIGKPGGRPVSGAFDPAGMREPAQIAFDAKGRLWVTEETLNPKRTSVWDPATGRLVMDLVGTGPYAGAGGINPFDPTMAMAPGTVYRLDWATGASVPVWSVGASGSPDDLFPPEVYSITQRVTKHGADTLVFTNASWSVTQVALLRDGVGRSAAAFGVVQDPEELRRNQYAPEAVRRKFSHPVFAGHAGEAFAWADANGDGLVQPAEMRFGKPTASDRTPYRLQVNYWGNLPGEDAAMLALDIGAQALLKFPVTGYTPSGAPMYDPAHPTVIKPDRPLLQSSEGMVMGGADGVVYFNQDPLMAMDAKGHVLFTYPSHHVSVHGSHTATAARPGYLIGPSSILGTAEYGGAIGEVFDMNGNLGENVLFTRDGLLIQTLFKDVRGGFDVPTTATRGMSLDGITAGSESFGGNFVRAANGKTYLTIGGTDARVLEVTGLESIQRLKGAFTFTPDQYAEAQAIARQNAARAAEPKTYTIARATTAPVVDGKTDEWPELTDDARSALDLRESADLRFGRVSARYDDANLYLAYRVVSPSDHPRNSGQDERLLFKTGDAVDLMLGPSPQQGLEGDLRLLFTVKDGKPIAILNRKVAPDAPASRKYVFTAPWHTVAFDEVAPAPDVRVATAPAPGGYAVEVAIPWKTLGVTPKPGLTLKGDVGILAADNAGVTTVARRYWSNKVTALVSDVPFEADLTPELWGTFTLE